MQFEIIIISYEMQFEIRFLHRYLNYYKEFNFFNHNTFRIIHNNFYNIFNNFE